MKPVTLIILDGVGYNENPKGNAVMTAHTPNFDFYRKKYPHCLLEASGEAVGLPPGFQGSSEVGHLSMGVGRVIRQELLRINDQLTDGSLFSTKAWKKLIENWKTNQSQFHFIGLLQDEGVHAHQDHLFKLMKQARAEYPDGRIVIHPFLDGRDTPPWSTLEFFALLRKEMDEVKNCEIGTFMGRYYGMDRAKNWDITDKAFSCLVDGNGIKTQNPETAIKESYKIDKTPSGEKMFDEYILPHIVIGYEGVLNGDSILHTNYRQDRAIQLTKAFTEQDYPGERNNCPKIEYAGLTQYYDEFSQFLLKFSQENSNKLDKMVGQVVSDAGFRQLRLAETQKFRHVTSFFNGKSTTPFPKEDQVEVPSRFDPASFANHPEMEAYNIVDKFMELTQSNPYRFILINFANGDMVGHTGNFNSAVKAVEILDECVGKIVDRLLELDGKILITADHGNCDQMVNYSTGQVRTSHSTVPVECVYIANEIEGIAMEEKGKLSDIGPTILKLMELPIPEEMTASNLIKG
ncbi:MAG: 2,3-bisphosphoglycerate-independent phosphoglycerate mutase [Candidatus Marinimicrobia bacterium]|nr:2,3-bisphosphoglycerate-independent phosphoglycerate mutase [Candidatus Neomarinimicrobiota bacterium]